MFVLLVIFYLSRVLRGAPLIDDQSNTTADILAGDLQHRSYSSAHPRGEYDIVVSCLTTVFACAWTAIHPNIPSMANSRWNGLMRRILTTVYALIAPETITAWALLQNFAAKKIARNYNNDFKLCAEKSQGGIKGWLFDNPSPPLMLDERVPWTETHGFFLQMGGFMLCRNGQPIKALESYDGDDPLSLRRLILDGKINAPRTTEEEIQDRSKGDFISKFVVVAQTSWFVTQCIARWSTNLAVTELEVVTLGFAILNTITYAFWWNKPQNVKVPIFLELNVLETEDEEDNEKEPSQSPKLIRVDSDPQGCEDGESDHLMGKGSGKMGFFYRKLEDYPILSSHIKDLWDIPHRVIQEIVRPLGNLQAGAVDTSFVKWGKLDVPKFFAQSTPETETQFMVIVCSAGLTAVIFGCVHLFPAWFLDYPSHTEMWLWRLSAAIITIEPFIICLSAITTYKYGQDAVATAFTWLALLSLPSYTISRITIIILALASLRDLPDSASQYVDWIALVPHF